MIQGILKKVFSSREKFAAQRLENPEEEKPFLEHLEDLRTMIFRIVITLFVSLLVCFIFHAQLIWIIEAPLTFITVPVEGGEEGEVQTLLDASPLISIDPTGVFMMAIKVAFLAALTVSFPFIIYFILQFVLPGLKDNEKKILWPAMGVGFGLFLMGVLFAYFVVVPRAMQFFYMFGVDKGIIVQWTVEMYTKFAVRFILIFGICFELPVVVMSLVKLDILNYRFMSQRRGLAIIIIFFVAALITPTHDALTLALLGAPMYILYEICIWMSFFIERKDRRENPELYEERDRIEAELEAETDSAEPIKWGGFQDGFGGGDDDDDDDDDDDPDGGGSGPRDPNPDRDPDHDDSWDETNAGDPYYHDTDPHGDDPYHQDHDDYHSNLHDPDKDGVDDPDHGGGTKMDASSTDDHGSTDDHSTDDSSTHHDPYHDPYHYNPYHGYYDEHDDYHRKLAELQEQEHRAHVAGDPDNEPTLEEFSARDESGADSDKPEGAAPGDTTGIGEMEEKKESRQALEHRLKRLETLILRMSEKIQFLEDHQDL